MRKVLRVGAVYTLLLALLLVSVVIARAQTPSNGQASANIVVQNLHQTETANVVASYVGPGGVPEDSLGAAIPRLSAGEFLSSATGLPGGWLGSMVLYSDRELASVAMLLWDGGPYADGKSAAAYTGFESGDTTWYVPALVVNPGVEASQITVQNVDTEALTFYIDYYERGDVTPDATIDDTLEPSESIMYDLGTPGGKVPDLVALSTSGVNWTGAAVVTSTQQIAVIQSNHWRGWSSAYEGSTAPSDTLSSSSISRRRYQRPSGDFWAEFSVLSLQNPNAVSTDVTINFYDRSDGLLDLTLDHTIPAHSAAGFNLKGGGAVPASTFDVLDTDTTDADAIWVGYAVVTSTQPILGAVTVIQPGLGVLGTGVAGVYNLFAPAAGTQDMYVPAAYRIRPGGSWEQLTRMGILNFGSSEATLTLQFYDRNGDLDLELTGRTIAVGEIASINTKNGGTLATDTEFATGLGDNWQGSIYIHSTEPIAGITETLWWPSARFSVYGAVNK